MAMPLAPLTLPETPASAPLSDDGVTVSVTDDASDEPKEIKYDALAGIRITEDADGSVTVDFNANKTSVSDPNDFGANLAEDYSIDLSGLANDILQGIMADIESRSQLDKTYERGIDLLGITLEEAVSMANGEGTVSRIYDSTLLEAVIHYQATTSAEMLPAAGPVKAKDYATPVTPDRMSLAEDFENDMNYYLTSVRKEYYPDTRRMLFSQGFCGNAFKKVYRCPIRKAPVSDFVSMLDLIVSNDVVSLHNCGRITHKSKMRPSVMRRMQLLGVYLDVDLQHPNDELSLVDRRIRRVEGIMPKMRYEDQQHTIYECYTEVDLAAYGYNEPSAPRDLPLPYRVTIDKDSRQILEIRRNWRENDDDYRAIVRFVKFGFVPGLGFYDYGFIHILGNAARALTAISRQLIDAGQFANFPGFLLSKAGGRQETTQVRVPPGGAKTIETGGLPIGQVAMPLPYKEPSQVLTVLAKALQDNTRRLAMTADVEVGEGRADVPVGTVVAMIEQATKSMAALHKQNHSSQQEEFEKLKELFAEDPEALSKFARSPRRRWSAAQEFQDLDLVPVSDPNVPSHMHRVMMATALSQLINLFPELNRQMVLEIILTTLGYSTAGMINPPAPPQPNAPPPDPVAMANIQLKRQQDQREAATALMEIKARQQEQTAEDQNAQLDRESKERVEQMKLQEASLKQQQKPVE